MKNRIKEEVENKITREIRSGAMEEDKKEFMKELECIDTQSHLKKCGKCNPELEEIECPWCDKKHTRKDLAELERLIKKEYIRGNYLHNYT